MKSRYLIAIIIAAVIILVMSAIPFFSRPRTGDVAPPFVLKDISGKEFSLKDQKGKQVFLHFWATWCGTCVSEIPAMEKLYQKYKDTGLVILTILVDDDGASIDELKRRTPISYPILIDPKGKAADAYKVWGVPETFIISKDGIIKTRNTTPIR